MKLLQIVDEINKKDETLTKTIEGFERIYPSVDLTIAEIKLLADLAIIFGMGYHFGINTRLKIYREMGLLLNKQEAESNDLRVISKISRIYRIKMVYAKTQSFLKKAMYRYISNDLKEMLLSADRDQVKQGWLRFQKDYFGEGKLSDEIYRKKQFVQFRHLCSFVQIVIIYL